MANNKFSTSKLAEKLQMEAKVLFGLLSEHGYIERVDNKWRLSGHGEFAGGSYQQSEKYGEFIVWPESIGQLDFIQSFLPDWVSATRIGQQYRINARTVNALFSELGLINKDQRGWMISPRGILLSGEQRNSKQGFYVMWPSSVLQNKGIVQALENVNGSTQSQSLDGHGCENVAEQRICNWLYLHHLAHAYKRPLPGSDYECSFYLPERKIYIEYFGIKNIKHSLSENMQKQAFYKENGLSCIELHDEDLTSLDEVLPQKLLQFGLQIH